MFLLSPILIVVTEMKKTESEKKGSFAGKLFRRLFKASAGFLESVSLQERDAHVGVPGNRNYDYQKENKTALLEAEREKAEAIAWQRRHIIC